MSSHKYQHTVTVTYVVEASTSNRAVEEVLRNPTLNVTRVTVRAFHHRLVHIPLDLWRKIMVTAFGS